jgi:SAM-dependent methyltransferase
VLVDRCETTLAQNRLFARSAGVAMEIRHEDIRDLSCERVEAVVAHTFLNFFPRDERQKVVDSWARNLVPGGRLLLSQRLLPGKDKPRKPRARDEIKRRLSAIGQAAVSAGFTPRLVGELLGSAEELWSQPLSEDRVTYSDFTGMLERSGFGIVRSTMDEAGASVSPIATAEFVDAVPRCEIVAVKLP